jgi:hypothetical protein
MWAERPDEGATWVKGWPQFQEGGVRLLAAFEGITLLSLRGLAIQPIATPGFVGVIDLEAGAPDVSRHRAIRGDVSDVLQRARLAVREQVVDNLNAVESEGLIIEKHEFIARCVRLYERQVILDSSLRWISCLKLPGEVELISCAALLDRITRSRSLFVARGTGPWTAMKRWVAFGSQPIESEPAVVLDDSPSDRLGYHSGSEERIGPLVALWPNCAQADLFGTILRVAAEAWQISLEDLCNQDGWRHAGSALWGRLTRP